MAYSKAEKYRSDNARKVNAKKFPHSYLYIIKIVDSNLYKIGVSNNPKRRIRDISGHLPYDIEVKYCAKHPHTYNLEEMIHDNFREQELRHEWFELSSIDLIAINNTLKDFREGNIFLTKRRDYVST